MNRLKIFNFLLCICFYQISFSAENDFNSDIADVVINDEFDVNAFKENDGKSKGYPNKGSVEKLIQDIHIDYKNKDLDLSSTVSKFDYVENKTYPIKMAVQFETAIVLPKGEIIAEYSIRHSSAFEIYVPESDNPNRILLNAKYTGVDTNLIVFGRSGLVYSFYIQTVDASSKKVDFVIHFNSNVENLVKEKQVVSPDYFNSLDVLDLSKNFNINVLKKIKFRYEIKNSSLKYNVTVFDDGVFTYFSIGDKVKNKYFSGMNIPSIYISKDGYDHIVDVQKVSELNLLVVKSINKRWTIREGNALGENNLTACVYSKNQ